MYPPCRPPSVVFMIIEVVPVSTSARLLSHSAHPDGQGVSHLLRELGHLYIRCPKNTVSMVFRRTSISRYRAVCLGGV